MSFEKLLQLNVNDKTEKKKSGYTTLTYLSWSFAWSEFVKVYPDATYTIIKNERGLPYFLDESGAMVYTTVTANGLTHEMWLPVMDGANKAMKKEAYEYSTKNGTKTCAALDMFDVNKTVMRCLVKNLAMFGLGLYIYAGEDLPESLPEPIELINQDEVLKIEKLISETNSDKSKFLTVFKISKLEDMPKANLEKALNALKSKLEKK